ncbi:MAG: DNA-binding protein WhiA [Bacillota bacterium]
MSFSSLTKDELAKARVRTREEKRAMLMAFVNAAGSLTLERAGRMGLQFTTENHAVGKLIAQTGSTLYQIDASVALLERDRLNARNIVVKFTGEAVYSMLVELGVLNSGEEGVSLSERIPLTLIDTEASQKAFLRAAFLGAGSVSDPKRYYHLEFVCRSERFACALQQMMERFSFHAKTVLRKGSSVVYLKEGEQIADFLTLIGASGSTLEFESARVVKNVRNYVNRTSNCETANLQKTVRAAVRQKESILAIKRLSGLESLPQPLQEMAELRLNYPEASLLELSELSGVGRSGVNHRLNRLMQIAHDLKIEKGEF